MSTTFNHPGDVVPFIAPSGGVTKGVPVLIVNAFVIPKVTVAVGVEFNGDTVGVHTLPKTSAQAWVEGERIYWDDGNTRCDSDATLGQLIGYATKVTANPTATGRVRLNGTAPALSEGPQPAIVILTDNTGVSGSHDDDVADGLTATAPSAITDYGAVTDMTNPVTKTEGETFSAAMAALENEVTSLRSTVAACVTDLAVQNQNDSDLTQKFIEMRTALIAAGILTA